MKEMELEPGTIPTGVKPSKRQMLKRVQEIGKSCERDFMKELIEGRERDE